MHSHVPARHFLNITPQKKNKQVDETNTLNLAYAYSSMLVFNSLIGLRKVNFAQHKAAFPSLTSPPPIVSLYKSFLILLFHTYEGQRVMKANRNPPLDNSMEDQ